ncbi:N-acetyltransferase [Candidatus Woesearchaeota archaeon]|nr:N-acetyltransferase [Candidatus Woesearchaeota archaeon]
MVNYESVFIHPTAMVEDEVTIGEGTKIWAFTHVRSGARIGKNCVIGERVYVDSGVVIGDNCKIQNLAQLYRRLTLENGVFVGPGVMFANDLLPRAINLDGSLKSDSDWEVLETRVGIGAAIGMGSIVGPGRKIGEYALIGMGSLVTRDVEAYNLVFGNPAKFQGYRCKCGENVERLIRDCSHRKK